MEMDQFPMRADAYRLDYKIGSGSSAIVWAATCLENNRRVAVKAIDLEAHFSSLDEIMVGAYEVLENFVFETVHAQTRILLGHD
jgi:hypothetical protein